MVSSSRATRSTVVVVHVYADGRLIVEREDVAPPLSCSASHRTPASVRAPPVGAKRASHELKRERGLEALDRRVRLEPEDAAGSRRPKDGRPRVDVRLLDRPGQRAGGVRADPRVSFLEPVGISPVHDLDPIPLAELRLRERCASGSASPSSPPVGASRWSNRHGPEATMLLTRDPRPGSLH